MVIALIPARVGSKGIPNKNFTPLAGISPVERAFACCIEVGVEAYVCSDAEVEMPIGRLWVKRPLTLSLNTTPMRDVVRFFLETVGGPSDQVILLVQPTQPLRTPAHLQNALQLMNEGKHSVASVVETEPVNRLYYLGPGPRLVPAGIPVERRQDARQTFRCDGTVYAFRRAEFLANPSFRTDQTYPYVIPASESAALDTPLDWQIAELRLKAPSAVL